MYHPKKDSKCIVLQTSFFRGQLLNFGELQRCSDTGVKPMDDPPSLPSANQGPTVAQRTFAWVGRWEMEGFPEIGDGSIYTYIYIYSWPCWSSSDHPTIDKVCPRRWTVEIRRISAAHGRCDKIHPEKMVGFWRGPSLMKGTRNGWKWL